MTTESVSFEDIFDQETVSALESAATNDEYVSVLRNKISEFIGQKTVEEAKAAFYSDRETARAALQAQHDTEDEEFASTWQTLEDLCVADGDWTRRPK